ncbi:MAG: FKBP-type peptidyl-prolyl cis-trans isomerase [Bacteroidales bacterium]|nr:FKBP-type peptidyl-prolyl cis-trans isomerase [Bacteroidales bacterium]
MKLRKLFILTIVMATGAAIIFSCTKGNHPGFKKTKTGIYYKIYTPENKDTSNIHIGSIITMHLNYGMKDSVLFDSRNMPEPVILPVIEPSYEGDFYEALQLFNQGDSGSIILKAGPFFKTTFRQPSLPDFLTDDTDLYFDIVVLNVQTEEEAEFEMQARNAEMEQEEMIEIEKYIQDKNITVSPTASGVYYIETKKGKGLSPLPEYYVSAHFTVYLLNGDKLFSTIDRGEPIEFRYGNQFENPGFQEALGFMKEGGKANAIVPSSMAFGAQGAGNGIVPPFSSLYYDIELVDVITPEEWEKKQSDRDSQKQADMAKKERDEEVVLQKFLKDNNIIPTTTLPGGLIYIEKEAGTGSQPTEGQKVKVHYTGKLIDGKVFDSSTDRGEPLEFVIGRGAVIEGWDKGIPLMKTGGKATLIVPSKMGYKDQGAGNIIPPYATLIFDVELVSVE